MKRSRTDISGLAAKYKPTLLSPQQMAAIKHIIDFAASHCGGGEDTIGAIMYTGAFHALGDKDADVVTLAKLIDGRN